MNNKIKLLIAMYLKKDFLFYDSRMNILASKNSDSLKYFITGFNNLYYINDDYKIIKALFIKKLMRTKNEIFRGTNL